MSRSSESDPATAGPPSNIVPYGGARFDLEEGINVPYIAPKDMGLSSPTGGNDAFAFDSEESLMGKKITMISKTEILHRPGEW